MTSAIARVFVNQVEVGSVPLTMYRELVTIAWKSPRLYIAQIMNLCGVIFKFVTGFLTTLPVLLVGIVGLAAWFWPGELQSFIEEIRTRTAAELVVFIQQIWPTLFLLYVMIQGFRGMFSNTSFGFINHFSADIHQHLRHLLEVPVDGVVTVIEGTEK